MPTLEDAIALAASAHAGQRDKMGEPYILHPIRVMLRLKTEDERTVAILHDVVEDTHVTLDELRRLGYSEEIVQAVELLSRREGETYAEFIERVRPNALATRVKLADLEDNMDLRRQIKLGDHEIERLTRYFRAYGRLRHEGASS